MTSPVSFSGLTAGLNHRVRVAKGCHGYIRWRTYAVVEAVRCEIEGRVSVIQRLVVARLFRHPGVGDSCTNHVKEEKKKKKKTMHATTTFTFANSLPPLPPLSRPRKIVHSHHHSQAFHGEPGNK